MSTYTKHGYLKAVLIALVTTFAVMLTGCGVTTDTGENVGEISENLCSGVALAASPASPKNAGTQVTLTASGATCGGGQTAEYRFYHIVDYGPAVMIRDYNTSAVANWDTTGLASGSYAVLVYARAVGSAASFESIGYLPQKYLIGNVCNNATSFTTSLASPQPPGTMIGLSATASCTGGSPEFRYAYKGPGDAAYVYLGGYGAANQTWNTTGRVAGAYSLLVLSRAIGNASASEASRVINYSLGSAATLCTNAALSTASPASPQPVGTMVSLTGTATCSAPQFRFWYRLYPTSTWLQVGAGVFGAATQVWDTTGKASGLYEILTEARQTGNVGAGESNSIAYYTLGNACSTVTLATNPPSPQGAGVVVQMTGAATCSGTGTPEYQFSYKAPGASTLTIIQAYSASTTANWATTGLPVGNYTAVVQSRAVGSTATQEGLASANYVISGSALSQIQAGLGTHVCARVNDGTARCWGSNDVGQLGTGSTSTMSSLPVAVTGLSNVAAVSTGGFHSCALLTDGTVRCWGQGSDGQLGNGGTAQSSSPVVVSGLSDAVAISSGTYHNCVVRTGGVVSCWGDNSYFQTSSQVAGEFPMTKVPSVVTGITASAVYAAGFHTCALVGSGLKCWGDNSLGQLGNGGTPTKSITPVDVTGLTSGVSSMSGGDSHSCAVVGGAVRCWGDNTYGQIGNGSVSSTTPVTTPVTVAGLAGVTQVAAGFTFSCARIGGAAKCWGRNANGELGNGTGTDSTTPVSVSGVSSATSITAGSLNGCVLLSTNAAQCWGYGASGTLGNGTSGADAKSPVTVTFP